VEKKTKSVIFVDIRNFTKACEISDVVLAIDDILEGFYLLIEKFFPDSQIKYIGDGAMVLANSTDISLIIDSSEKLRREFRKLCSDFSKKKGLSKTLNFLDLGIGITKGDLIEIDKELNIGNIILRDYISPKINLASRLCQLARPHGIVIHKESFPNLPDNKEKMFDIIQLKNIPGLEKYPEIRCFAEKHIKLPDNIARINKMNIEVHVTGLCFYNNKLLLCKRGEERDIEATKWAGPGGKILPNKSFEESLKEIFKREVDIEISNLKLIDTYFIETHGIPGIVYFCELESGTPRNADGQSVEIKFFSERQINEIKSELLPSLEAVHKGFKLSYKLENKLSAKLRIALSLDCNLSCKYCHLENIKLPYSTDMEKIKRSINIINEHMKISKITITGGEPFFDKTQNYLFFLLSYIEKNYPWLFPISIVTNGLLLNREVLRKLSKYNILLKISIYGTNDKDFQEYTGVCFENYLDNIINILKIIQNLGMIYSVNILLRKKFEKKIDDLIDIIKENDLTPSKIKIIQMVSPKNILPQFKEDFMQLEESKYYDQNYLFDIEGEFPPRKGLKYKNENIELYKYPCYNEENCKFCFENWGTIILPNGSLYVCENAFQNERLSEELDKLDIPIVKWKFKKDLEV